MPSLLPVLGVFLVILVSPGPDFLVTVHFATTRSRRHGVLVGLGVTSGVVLWAGGAMLGLAVLFARLSWLYDLVRYAGAAYLLYLGLRTLWSTRRRRDAGPAHHPVPAAPGGPGRAWRTGFLTNIGNPKAAAFFGSLFGALLPAGTSPAARTLLVAVVVALTAGWYTVVAVLFGLPRVARVYRRARRWIDRVVAAVLIALGGRLALDR